MPRIIDNYTDQPISRQRKWQLRARDKKLCETCGEPVLKGCRRCAGCLEAARERARKRLGCHRRYHSKGYVKDGGGA